jgi:hypothetical protein
MGYRNAPPYAWDLREIVRPLRVAHEHSINLIVEGSVMVFDDTCGLFLLYSKLCSKK